MTTSDVPSGLWDVASALVPDAAFDSAKLTTGQFHHVVLLPGIAAVRISRNVAAAAALARRTELLRHIARCGLPFAVPEPLTPVTQFGDRAAVALSWIDGAKHPKGEGDPRALRKLLTAIREVPLIPELRAVLGEPHEYAGGPRWADLMAEEVIPRLPENVRSDARRRVKEALDLERVPAALVHGDLSGENVHWSANGELIGVLDWDVAQPFDHAIDAACLAWHGWETVRAAVDAETYRRAGVWYLTFGIEQVAAAVLAGESSESLDRRSEQAAAWLTRTANWTLP